MSPLEKQIACVKREIGMRERVYPTWVGKGKMTTTEANAEIATMKAVLKTLEWLESNEEAIKAKVRAA